MTPPTANIASHLPAMALRQPDAVAVKVPRGRRRGGAIDYLALGFAELDAEADAWARRLVEKGVRRGDRVLVMVRPGLPLIATSFALFKLGAVPVVIDPGMGLRSFLRCVARSRPRALLGIPLAQCVAAVARRAFAGVDVRICVSGDPARRISGGRAEVPVFAPADTAAGDLAAILFTSGSTGEPKGVCYEHGMFAAQVRLIRELCGIEPGEVDLPMLPVFALFDPALGMTAVMPEINPGRPATVDPAKIVQAVRQEGVTNSFGSPTIWRKISAHCRANNLTLPTMQRVLMAGAPVPPGLWAEFSHVLPNGRIFSPYGATEALPVSMIGADEVLGGTAERTRAGAGTCVGRPAPEMRVRIIPVTDGPIASMDKAPPLPAGQIGEIAVAGPVVTRAYDALPEATAAAKIIEAAGGPGGEGAVWHRMGDTGYLDPEGRLWFCGRKAERVETAGGVLFTECCEPVFSGHPKVARVALLGIGPRGSQEPVLAVEPVAGAWPRGRVAREAFAAEILAMGRGVKAVEAVRRVVFVRRFPVDVRHNAKIHRLSMARRLERKGV